MESVTKAVVEEKHGESVFGESLARFASSGASLLECHIDGNLQSRDILVNLRSDRGVNVKLVLKGRGVGQTFVIPQECLIGLRRSEVKKPQRMTIEVFNTHVMLKWAQKRFIRPAGTNFPKVLTWAEEAIAGDVFGTTIELHTAGEDRHNARLALTRGRTRQRGARIRELMAAKVTAESECPYCNLAIGEDWQADHIEPVSRGGLSMLSNMVPVCYRCNQNKRDMNLAQFILAHSFDFDSVISKLQKLNKRVDEIDPDPQMLLF